MKPCEARLKPLKKTKKDVLLRKPLRAFEKIKTVGRKDWEQWKLIIPAPYSFFFLKTLLGTGSLRSCRASPTYPKAE